MARWVAKTRKSALPTPTTNTRNMVRVTSTAPPSRVTNQIAQDPIPTKRTKIGAKPQEDSSLHSLERSQQCHSDKFHYILPQARSPSPGQLAVPPAVIFRARRTTKTSGKARTGILFFN